MIRIGGRKIGAVYAGHRALSTIYQGARLVWQAVRSCFGAGLWVNVKPWLNEEGWRNN
ncbi:MULTISPECIES: MFS transporter [Mediterranea]|uniref:MFS transporter n=1 Tax=Mediterranea TaxID=1926659 RepID=UPI002012AEE5|nr:MULTISPECIES: MFS transporter [Mediterranea]MCL1606684.1 MFS transporter [Mediterranea sp. ET5]MDM8122730.1 MFS transporter [Mediterranea massiliensis]MDM8197186.1 MFS transporter [Mediterranea massiliensis]